MSYEISVLSELNIVKLTFKGELTMEIRIQGLTDGAQKLMPLGYGGLIIDVTKAEMGPDEVRTDALKLINFMKSLGMQTGSKIAIIRQAPDERRQYFAQLANMAGIELSYFDTQEEARTWMNSL